ncbi:IclR family transcriptional regulator [Pseudonocardia acaciae]|uniref:IclR family transcriptional regulator n=1 Tax=Pseudonocardia acaciae TaxID=551276 RepID=UPI00048C8167|nr:IclR family transcriptional regulator [Pseudonocardia acaciae]
MTAARNNSASLRRALGILLHLGADAGHPRGSTLTELASVLELNKSTLLRLLAPLRDARLVEQDGETGRYRLGWRTAQLGQAYLERLDLRAVAQDVLHGLMADTGETAHLVIADLPDVVYVDKVDTPQPVRMYSRIGVRQPAYCTAVGKAMLAHAGEDAVRSVVERGMPPRTPNTHTTEVGLRAELTTVREHGYAVDEIENEPDIRCVGAPIFDHTGAATCAVSVSGPATRVTRERVGELGRLVLAAAADISRRLGATR